METSYEHLSIGPFDNEGAFEDILGNQYALDADDFSGDLKQKKGNFSDVDMDQVKLASNRPARGTSHISQQGRISIDLDTIESDVEVVSYSGLSSPSPIIKKEDLNPLTAPAGTKKIVIDLSESDNEGDMVIVDQVPSARIKEDELQQQIRGGIMEIPKNGGADASVQRLHLAPNQSESTLNPDQSSRYTSIFGRDTTVEDSAFNDIQQKFVAKTLGNPIVTGAGSIFKGLQGVPPEPERSLRDTKGDDARMYENLEGEETDAATAFHKLKKGYKARVKAGENTVDDDILYLAAETREKVRLRRLEIDYLQSRGPQAFSDDSDVAVESDNNLFVPQFPAKPSTAKRVHEMTMDGSERLTANEELDDSPKAKRRAVKDQREQAKELQEALRLNRQAGVEQIIYAQERKDEREAAAKEDQERKRRNGQGQPQPKGILKKASVIKTTASRFKGKNKTSRLNPAKPGRMNDLRNLGNCDIYDQANANADKAPRPADSTTRKSDALKVLMANVPLEDLRAARRDKADIIKSSKTLGFRAVRRIGDNQWKVKGVASPLYDYQLQGSAWMREREIGLIKPNGGLLADQMGLGKTVMTIATMVANQPTASQSSKATLIVATPALVTQWMEEFERHIEPGVLPGVIKHCGSTRIAGTGAEHMMSKADIILTTYGEVLKSYPRFEPPEELKTLEEKLSWWDGVWDKTRGSLHRIHFHRVVLDEAHVIKNHKAQTSVCCRALMAKNRWAITGTPIHNRVQELYPYFKFLRVPHTGSYAVFQENFCVPGDEDCTDRLHTFLKQFTIRRTHATQLCGQPLIQLPKNHQRTIYVEFNSIERALYDMVLDRYVKGINHLSSEGLLEKKHHLILTMLQKLRQMTAHPFLIQDTIERLFQTSDLSKLLTTSDKGREDDDNRGKDMVSAMKRMIESRERSFGTVEDEEDDAGSDSARQPLRLRFQRFLRCLQYEEKWQEHKERCLCHKCKSPPDHPRVTSCLHLYCRECLRALTHDAVSRGEQETTCTACGTVFMESCSCEGLKELEVEEPLPGSADRPVKRRKKDHDADIKWMDVGGELLPSSKTAAVQVQLEQWLTVEPEKKIIVFSQFRMLMRIVERICEKHKWGFCSYQGDMSHEARSESLKKFRDQNNIKVLVASLKCGGVGLNLTMASKVICVDLWWNSSVEQQAFCRVFRIGQTEETYITRFVVKNSIDEKLEKLQKEKDAAIFTAIDDSRMLRTLSVKNLMRLFGPVRHEEDGKPFILVNDDGDGDRTDLELSANDIRVRSAAKSKKGKKAKGVKSTKGAKSTKEAKKASGKGSRGGKGAKAANARQDEADLEAIELDIPSFDAEA